MSCKDVINKYRVFYSRPQQRQRLHSDDSGTLPLKICACFAPPRAWMYAQRESSNKVVKRAVDSLFIMACHGNLIQYDLDPKPAAGILQKANASYILYKKDLRRFILFKILFYCSMLIFICFRSAKGKSL